MENEEKELLLYSLDIEDLDYDSIDIMSVVKYPAMESDFMAFGKNSVAIKLQKMTEGVITGVALRPDKKIYRNNDVNEFNVIFSKESVKKIAKFFFKNHNQDNTTIEHSFNVNNLYIYESWIVRDPANDTATALGLDVQEGDWVITMDVSGNKEVMAMIEDGEVRGFSLEGYFSSMLIENSNIKKDEIISKYDQIAEIVGNTDTTDGHKYDEIEKLLKQ